MHPSHLRDGVLTTVKKLDYFGNWYDTYVLRTPMELREQPRYVWTWPEHGKGPVTLPDIDQINDYEQRLIDEM